jgi:hypothetical protein
MKSEGRAEKQHPPDPARAREMAESAIERTREQMAHAPDPAKTREMAESAIERTRRQFIEDGTVELLHRALAELRGRRAGGFAVDELVLADLERFCAGHPTGAKA